MNFNKLISLNFSGFHNSLEKKDLKYIFSSLKELKELIIKETVLENVDFLNSTKRLEILEINLSDKMTEIDLLPLTGELLLLKKLGIWTFFNLLKTILNKRKRGIYIYYRLYDMYMNE